MKKPDFPTRRSPVFLVIYLCVANWSGLAENAKTPTETTLADYEPVAAGGKGMPLRFALEKILSAKAGKPGTPGWTECEA